MVWICTKCNGKNNNSSNKCRINKCHAEKPEIIKNYEKQKEKEKILRDYCPVCKSHQDFKKWKGKTYICPRCHRRFKFKGKPVPEHPLITNALTNEINKQNIKF